MRTAVSTEDTYDVLSLRGVFIVHVSSPDKATLRLAGAVEEDLFDSQVFWRSNCHALPTRSVGLNTEVVTK